MIGQSVALCAADDLVITSAVPNLEDEERGQIGGTDERSVLPKES